MGIPCYFSQLIRRHKAVVVKYRCEQATNFCLDSNSIVYDAVRDLPYTGDDAEYEAKIIALVCARIAGYIAQVRPKRVCIAFDGVPPMAKMKQQRERRHKSRLEPRTGWETVQITPGTKFMKKLDAAVHAHFEPTRGKYEFLKITTSDEPGEGEHKIFDWLRTNPGGDTFVYGLDSDLIILALHHLKYGKIKLLREAPAFAKDQGLQLLDANLLATQINALMGADKVPDYVFITLFLGNDFMPHFPALNLRTRGLDVLLATYKSVVGSDRLFDGTINWPVVQRFVAALAKRETGDFAKEYADRNQRQVENTPENKPMVRREVEHYINPPSPGWEDRYYRALLKMDAQNTAQLCGDFYDILTWNVQYYTTGCPDWELYYPHMYPPLLRDLAKFQYAPRQERPTQPKSSVDLLKFVMPAQCAHYSAIEYTPEPHDEPEMHWAFCTFLWEAHLLF